jgi:hypothetical protein
VRFFTLQVAATRFVFGGMLIAAAITLSGCNRDAADRVRDQSPTPTQIKSADKTPAKQETETYSIYANSAEEAVGDKVVSLVNSVSLDFPDSLGRSMVIKAQGLAPGGAASAALLPMDEEEPDTSVRKFKFVAVPGSRDEDSAQSVYVRLFIDDVPREVRTIQIVAEQNVLSVAVARPVENVAGPGSP